MIRHHRCHLILFFFNSKSFQEYSFIPKKKKVARSMICHVVIIKSFWLSVPSFFRLACHTSYGLSSSSSSCVFLVKADDSSCSSSSCDWVQPNCCVLLLFVDGLQSASLSPMLSSGSNVLIWSICLESTGMSLRGGSSGTSWVSALLLDRKLVSRDFSTCRPKSPTSS